MVFHGFQKMTVLDYPEKVACTLFTAGCNFRCPFCHNALLVTEIDNQHVYEPGEILAYLQKRRGILDGVCVTGGEPLMHPDLADFLREVKDLGYAVKVDTNGSYPDRLRALVESGVVDYIAMDIKNCREKYGITIGIPDFDLTPVEESVRYLMGGAIPFEFRTTIVREFHTVEDIAAIADRIAGAPKYFLQSFKESDHMIGAGLHAHPEETLREMQKVAQRKVPAASLRGI